MKIVERINFCPTCFSFWHTPLLGWIMGSFIGALLIGKVRGSWIRTHLHPLSAYVNSFPALILSSPCLFQSFTFFCRIEKCFKSFTGSEHKKSHTAFPMEMQLVHYKVNLIYIFGILESESSNINIGRIWGTSVGGVFRPGGCPEGGSIWLSCSSFSFLFGTASFTGKYLSQNILANVYQTISLYSSVQVDLPSFDLLIAGLSNISQPTSQTQVTLNVILVKVGIFATCKVLIIPL